MKRVLLNWAGVCLAVSMLAGCDLSDLLAGMRSQPTKPGLRLVLQAEPVKSGETVTAEQLQVTRDTLEKRGKDLGVPSVSAQVGRDGKITVELQGADDFDPILRALTERGFVELLDGGDSPPQTGEVVITESGGPPADRPQPDDPRVWPVVVTSDEMDTSKIAAQLDSTTNMPQVAFTLTESGAKKIADFTSNNINKFMPVVLDKRVISVPMIMGAIPGGSGVIRGLSLEETRTLAAQMKSGTLPVNLKLLETTIIEP
jgi:preprotein translocase subunit SecD